MSCQAAGGGGRCTWVLQVGAASVMCVQPLKRRSTKEWHRQRSAECSRAGGTSARQGQGQESPQPQQGHPHRLSS